MKLASIATAAALLAASTIGAVAQSGPVCQNFGPQTPRDIANPAGTNRQTFPIAPAANAMNLCNIHFHTNAEHKGPGFSTFAGPGEHGGYKCNESGTLTPAELQAPAGGVCKNVKPGDTIEVHWVYSTCTVAPGEGLKACSSAQCTNPTLRVESQVFLVVNDSKAASFAAFDYSGSPTGGVHQPRALPSGTGTPVVFRGSTTGPDFTQQKCSPLQVTWSVRPSCAKIDIGSLSQWCQKNAFQENHAHGVRALVTAAELLDSIR